jgi:tetratricopeptide (TPR) repeat protein
MVLFIARSGELLQSPQTVRLRESGAALRIREIELAPLTNAESRDLLRSLIQPDERQPSKTEHHALLWSAAGYPMVLELLVQDWKASGEESLALSVNAMTENFGAAGPAPNAYQQILARITCSLDSATHNVLNLASILGHRLNDLSLYAIVDLSTGQTVRSMADLVSRRVLRDGVQGLEFVNELVRAAAYIGVPPTLRRILHGNIADSLIQRHSGERDDLGLEIAWHCIRAGRGAEATPYLLDGAREAIRSGAPYEAERGLSTAIPNLTGTDRTGALVLLAEALQEQSRWTESLHSLEQIDMSHHSSSTEFAFVLKTRAMRYLGHTDSAQLTELSAKLLEFVESAASTSSRIRAAVELASVLNTIRCRTLTPAVLESLSSFDGLALEEDDFLRLLLARSMLYYNVRDLALSLQQIGRANAILLKRHTPNTILAMLQNGMGAILNLQGAYASSIPFFLSSYETAIRIGSETIHVQASANLALSYTRVGQYEDAIRWADRALTRGGPGLGGSLQAAQSALLSHAMLGNSEKTEDLIRKRGADFANFGSPGILQAWRLYSADALAMLGRLEEATEEGCAATAGVNRQLHLDFCVGPYARWVARSSCRGAHSESVGRLGHLMCNLENYDCLDQAEVFNALSWVEGRGKESLKPYDVEMQKRLNMLPQAVVHQLKRMGML